MKKSILLMVFAVGLLSCTRAEQHDPAQEDERVAIVFGTNVVSVQTKGVGSVDQWDQNQTLYIYGFERNQDGSLGSVLIDNVAAAAPSAVSEGAIQVYDPSSQTQDTPFYYGYTQKYDFFGYYVDDAATGAPVNTGGVITVPVQIDGTQDILLGYADRTQQATSAVPSDRLYSAYAVRKGNIQPVLTFEHQLSRFVFNVIAGSEGDAPLYVNSLSVSSKTEGTLTVTGATRGLVAGGTAGQMSLTNRGAALTPYLVSGTGVIGESIMVMPGEESYDLSFVLEQGGKTVPQTTTIPISGGALKGRSYLVNLTIYSLESVKVNVTLTAWDESDELIEIGGDDGPVAPVEIVNGPSTATVPETGGEVEFEIKTEEEYTLNITADWVRLIDTRAQTQILTFEVDENTTGETRSCQIRFIVEEKAVAVFTIIQEVEEEPEPEPDPDPAPQFPEAFGYYWHEGSPLTLNQMSIYTAGALNQKWFRFLDPVTFKVYELGPLPIGLSVGDEFETQYKLWVRDQAGDQRTLQMHVHEIADGVLKLAAADGSLFVIRY